MGISQTSFISPGTISKEGQPGASLLRAVETVHCVSKHDTNRPPKTTRAGHYGEVETTARSRKKRKPFFMGAFARIRRANLATKQTVIFHSSSEKPREGQCILHQCKRIWVRGV